MKKDAALLLDITRLVDRSMQGKLATGIDRITLAYVAYFKDNARALIRFWGYWFILKQSDSRLLFDLLLQIRKPSVWKLCWWGVRSLLSFWRLPTGTVLLNTTHSGLDKPDYVKKVRQVGLSPIFYLHDLIPITYPEYGAPGSAEKHYCRLKTIFSVGKGVIVNSEETERELIAYGLHKNLPVPLCTVALPAPPELPEPSAARPIPEDYFVVLSTIEPRKNHLLLLHLWRDFAREMGEKAPRLVIIGQRGWECEQVEDLLERCELLKDVVIELSSCTDDVLVNWMKYAQALLFPSFVEGFGLPLVEALSIGTPVLASDLAVFREIAGDIPEYFHPLDAMSWRDAIFAYCDAGNARRESQIKRISTFKKITWEVHFKKVEALLKAVYERQYTSQ